MKIGAGVLFLILSALLFVGIVSWQRDQTRIKAATDAAEQVKAVLSQYFAEQGHLPFQLGNASGALGGPPEIKYPDRDAVYRLLKAEGPYVVVAGPRQGLLPPRAAGCAAIVYEKGALRVEWIDSSRIEAEQKRRDDLVAKGQVP